MLKQIWWMVTIAVLLVACGGGTEDESSSPTPTSSPTEAATRVPVPTQIPPTSTNLPPTWTPQPTATQVVGGSSNEGAASATPTFTPSNTPDISALCYIFEPKEQLNKPFESILSGDAATIFWKPIPLPEYQYQVQLIHQDGSVLLTEITSESSFTFPANLLISFDAVYGWEVIPYLNFETTCFAITGEIYVGPR